MAKILEMPKLSPTMEEGVLLEWHKKEGDAIEVDDLLAEVETDKATMEFRAFDKGTLLKQLVPPNTTVKLGQPVAIVGNAGEDVSELVAQAAGGAAAAAPKEDAPKEDAPKEDAPKEDAAKPAARATGDKDEGKEQRGAAAKAPAEEAKKPGAAAPKTRGSLLDRTQREGDHESSAPEAGRVLASPYVRKVARERGIDLSSAQGSGGHGRIMPADLEALASGGGEPAAAKSTQLARTGSASLAAPPGAAPTSPNASLSAPEVRKLSPMRKAIARRLTESKQTVPHFYLTIDVDAAPVLALRESINADLAAQAGKGKGDDAPKPEKISVNDLLIKAVAGALVRVPECNASFTEEAILVHQRVDVSVAVAIPDGLVTPVVRNADQKSVVAIAREVRDLASRARAKKLKPEEMSDGTFSISNLGMFGIDA
ncbi:MAG: Dihydrolipoamide acetyltransferase component of pyruvate dehydrogenase complex, partial [Labilithrix sp.]|nr:Dihydrolipoamide acetyltransferase component of pyruvate dehydrogenase complex [Labilithrix sp.]